MNFRRATLLTVLPASAAGLFSLATGCELIAVPDRSLIGVTGAGGGTGGSGGEPATTGGGMGGATTGGGQGGTGGTGGTGGGPECMMPSDCPGTTCNPGDCVNMACVNTNAPLDTACTEMNGSVCDGMGACVECNNDPQCTGNDICVMHVCAPLACMNMMQDGQETDVDCGGNMCPACADGLDCLIDNDCQSGVCNIMMICAAPTCTDMVQNGNETDTDCGGGTCPGCADGDTCVASSDCTSGFCHPTTQVCTAPTCMDTFQNQGETGVDCGGPCPACVGAACAANAACASGMCYNSLCVADLNGCDIDTATDMTGMGTATVTFPNVNQTYSPDCLKVSVNTVITFNGNFMFHPLQGGVTMGAVATPQLTGPFGTPTSTGMTADFTMPATAENLPYYCTAHFMNGMDGAVFVVP